MTHAIRRKSKAEPAPATTLFLFGAHGDLVKRLLMPALYNLSRDGLLGDGLRIVGVDHNAISDADFAKKLEDFIRTEAASKVKGNGENALDPDLWAQLAKGISYVEGDFLDDSTYADIGKKIADSGTGNAVFYLATAPRFFSDVVQRLGSAGLLTETDDSFRRVVIEKPFGSDLATAEALNASLLKVMIDNWRWVGVPFYLRTGKRMSVRDTEIVICFKPAPYAQFRDTEVDELKPTYLKIQIQPNEGMWFDLLAKKPGPTLDMANIQLGFAYKDFFEMQPSTGYETLIYDCMTGDQTLFQRADNIENGWRAVQPFLDAWKEDDGIQAYKAGEDGPAAADALLARDGRSWHSLG